MPSLIKDSTQDWVDILDNLVEPIVVIDFEGTIISWNKGAESLFGYNAAEASRSYDTSVLLTIARMPVRSPSSSSPVKPSRVSISS